jgi:hypothetical protein
VLRLSADDGVHSIAFDGATFTVSQSVIIKAVSAGTTLNLSWTGGSPPYVVQQTGSLPASGWTNVITTNGQSATVTVGHANSYFRVAGQ